jgi:hypothetical protein
MGTQPAGTQIHKYTITANARHCTLHKVHHPIPFCDVNTVKESL